MHPTAPLVLITGASSGIGQALAAEYARRGWRLALLARRGEALRAWALEQGLGEDRCVTYAVDVADTDAVLQAARDCLAQQGLPNVVIANAGVSMGVDSAEAEDIEVMAQTLAVNNVGLMATFSPFIAPMRARYEALIVGQPAALVAALAAEDPERDISLYINSPGGSVSAGMAIFDTMNFIKPDVSTLCTGMAASMGAFLLAAGAKDKRFSLPNSKIMIHQPLGGAQGQATEIEIAAREILKTREQLNKILAEKTGQPLSRIETDTERDYFLSAQEAKDYGLVDQVIAKRP